MREIQIKKNSLFKIFKDILFKFYDGGYMDIL